MNPRRFCDGGPHRAVQNQASCCTGRPRRTARYRKRPCGVRSPHYGAGKFAPSVSQKRKAVLEVRISEPPGAGISHSEIGKRLPEGPHKRRGGAAARCRRHRSSGDARRRHRRSRLAPERGCHEVTGVEKMRLLRKRRGPGICPVKKVEVPGFEPGQTEPKSVVLPLHHTSILGCKYNNYSVLPDTITTMRHD